MFVKLPFRIHNGNINQEADINKSVDAFIDLIVATQLGQFKADPNFGFIFKNHRFENFDEKKGTLASYGLDNSIGNFKITETSKNPNSFAASLKKNIEMYECRLVVNEVKMDYNAKKHNVKLLILGQIKGDKLQPYSHEINFYVW